jgi:MFS family permease
MPSPGTLRRNRDFRLFLVVVGLSRLGTQISFLALPLLTLRLTGSAARTGSLALLEGVIFLAMSLPGGALADHFPRRTTMVVCALGCAVAMGGLGAAVSLHHASFGLIAAAVVVIGVLGGIFGPASGASIRTIVAEGDLLDAYSTLEARSAVLTLVGPPLGGFLFGVAAQLPLWTDAASYVVCALGVLAVRTPLVRPRAWSSSGATPSCGTARWAPPRSTPPSRARSSC